MFTSNYFQNQMFFSAVSHCIGVRYSRILLHLLNKCNVIVIGPRFTDQDSVITGDERINFFKQVMSVLG